ncbi:MAG: hypothetical protein PWQ12_1512 [Clostridiales bacterium]|jgi:hypothetical protein|nr:hypothetical protein [Clostridiales bacterium]
MTKSVAQLVQTLEKESEIYREVLDISAKKREAIRAQRVEEIEKLTNYEQGLVVTLFKLEELRGKVVDVIMNEFDIDSVENVTELTQYMSADERASVMDAKNKLLVLVKNAVDENKFTSRLLEEKLNLISVNIELLTQVSDDSGTYDKGANNDAYERKNIFDARV